MWEFRQHGCSCIDRVWPRPSRPKLSKPRFYPLVALGDLPISRRILSSPCLCSICPSVHKSHTNQCSNPNDTKKPTNQSINQIHKTIQIQINRSSHNTAATCVTTNRNTYQRKKKHPCIREGPTYLCATTRNGKLQAKEGRL